jgi:hypothetical protein
MERYVSNKRSSIYIVGILLIVTILSIFVVFALGVLDQKFFSDNGAQPMGLGLHHESKEENTLNNKGNDNLVSGSKFGCDDSIDDMHTVKGNIDVVVDQDSTYEIPLCIKDQDDLAGLNRAINITATVCGGYVPDSMWAGTTDSNLILTQCGNTHEIDIVWHKKMKPAILCCCYEIYTAEFVFKEKICLCSSQIPLVSPDCLTVSQYDQVWGDYKMVDLDLEIKWNGCHFWTILK